ncbi:prepilin peptidase [uncultured Croceicoccus sp.]|uniref:A24 family peptidase n=1 Tax=uncultured Croceicoccus sp. TaxID=1295329 RepID=UPI00262BB32B|nr:prepilin peptidase [uncultured Croceicoccus sp.]
MDDGLLTYAAVAALAIAVLYAAFTDYRYRKIKNTLCLAIVVMAPLFWIGNGLSLWPGVAIQLIMAVAAFLVGAVLFRLGQVGGGDVKLLAAIALCMEPRWYLALIVFTALANGVLTLFVWHRHRRARRKGATTGRMQVPYAISVAAAMMAVIAVRYGAGLSELGSATLGS